MPASASRKNHSKLLFSPLTLMLVRLPCPIAELPRQVRSNEDSTQKSHRCAPHSFTSCAATEVRSGSIATLPRKTWSVPESEEERKEPRRLCSDAQCPARSTSAGQIAKLDRTERKNRCRLSLGVRRCAEANGVHATRVHEARHSMVRRPFGGQHSVSHRCSGEKRPL